MDGKPSLTPLTMKWTGIVFRVEPPGLLKECVVGVLKKETDNSMLITFLEESSHSIG